MPGIIGKKIGMTSVFDENGQNIPVTVVEAGPCYVVQVKTIEKDGYEAVQLAFDDKKESRCNKAYTNHFKKANVSPKYKIVEFDKGDKEYNLGDVVTVDIFSGDLSVNVVGTSKGKGFQGVVKRHGFGGVGGQTHGQHNRLRAPGSLGASSFPSKVFKGMRMAGRTGGDRVTVQNLTVVRVYPEKNVILIKGALPGAKGSYLIIEK